MIISGAVRGCSDGRAGETQRPRCLWWPGENACKNAKAFREIAFVMEDFRSSLADYPAILTPKQQLGNLHGSGQTDAPARWNQLDIAGPNSCRATRLDAVMLASVFP
jgi:hypothetical protein